MNLLSAELLDTWHRQTRHVAALGLLLVVAVSPAVAQDLEAFSVPAEFEKSLRLPGHGDHIRRPTALFEDKVHGEIVVADAGRNRLVFFDRSGVYRFEFDCADRIGSPIGVAVDSRGFVYVLGTSTEGRVVLRYDFDGFFLSELSVDGVDLSQVVSLTIDDQDQLVLLDGQEVIHVVDAGGQLVRDIDLRALLSESARSGLAVGLLAAVDGRIFVPVSTSGTVLVIDIATGQIEKNIGHAGNTAGELNFPIAVDVLPSGIVTVLDKMRFAVVCYSPDGRFLGEFGGKGFRDGWFYHPSLMVATESGEVIVGQIFESRIQVLRVPQMFRSRLSQGLPKRADEVRGDRVQTRSTVEADAILNSP